MRRGIFWILLLLIFVLGCTDPVTGRKSFFSCMNCSLQQVDVSKMKLASLDSDFFDPIQIIATYPAKDVNNFNSNLYKCVFGRKQDTVFVFELNKKVDNALLDEISHEGNGAIINQQVLKNAPKTTFIYVPKDFKLPDTAKCIFASPTAIEE